MLSTDKDREMLLPIPKWDPLPRHKLVNASGPKGPAVLSSRHAVG